MNWEEFDPYPDYPALWSLRAGRVLVACRAYLAGQYRLQIATCGEFLDILAPEF